MPINKFLITIIALILSSCYKKNDNKHTQSRSDKRPNIVFILSDDQGHGDFGFYGNPDIKTPHLDSIAKHSVRLTNFHAEPVCSPTRASLMTGRYCYRTGVHDTYKGNSIMDSSEITIAEKLKKAGYATGIFGKWHLGDNYPFRSIDQGFETSLVHMGGAIGQPGDHEDNFNRPDSCYFNPTLIKNGKPVKTSGYCTNIFTDAAIDFIKKNKDSPFFAYIPYNVVHAPFQAPKKYVKMYDSLQIDSSRYPNNVNPFPEMSKKDKYKAKMVYAMATNMDDNIQRIINTLKKEGLKENTLIIFMSDNGPQSKRYNYNLKKKKGSVFEGGINVPCWFNWPGKLPEGKEYSFLSAHFDIYPTLLDICDISKPDVKLDGMSFWPILQNNGNIKSFNNRKICFYWNRDFIAPYRNMAIFNNGYKLVKDFNNANTKPFELYDYNKDPKESNNISKHNSQKVKKMFSQYKNWTEKMRYQTNVQKKIRIPLGHSKENPVVLRRNDYITKGGYSNISSLGYWNISVVDSGKYDVKINFFRPTQGPGSRLFLKIGTVQQLIKVPRGTKSYTFEDIKIKPQKGRMTAWYDVYHPDTLASGKVNYEHARYGPFSIEVKKVKD